MPFKHGITTIQISPATREKLKDLGKKGETYEQIILKLIKEHKE